MQEEKKEKEKEELWPTEILEHKHQEEEEEERSLQVIFWVSWKLLWEVSIQHFGRLKDEVNKNWIVGQKRDWMFSSHV